MLNFDGKVALITGGGRGLGRSYAKALAARGAKIALNNRTESHANATAAEIEHAGGVAFPIVADLKSANAPRAVVEQTIDRFGRIDILINNAGGVTTFGPFSAISARDRDDTVTWNLLSTWDVTAAAWPHLVESRTAHVLMVTSPMMLWGAGFAAHYAAAKGAIVGLTKALAIEGKECGIRVNAISPIAYTPAAESLSSDQAQLADFAKAFPADLVAQGAAWLVHDDCKISGEILTVAGSRIARAFIAETEGYAASHAAFDADAIAAHEAAIMATDSFHFFENVDASLAKAAAAPD